MRAAWYEKQGAARDVLITGEMPDPEPGPCEVRIKVAASGINPGGWLGSRLRDPGPRRTRSLMGLAPNPEGPGRG
jgi:NADPH2:quinone reductase